jgi:hypothetical protein
MRSRIKGSGNDEIPEGRYANYFEIGHNAFEFLLDFGQLYFEEPEAGLHTRIVTSPYYAKALMGVLQQAISQHEQSYGRIWDDNEAMDEKERRRKNRGTPVLEIIGPKAQ